MRREKVLWTDTRSLPAHLTGAGFGEGQGWRLAVPPRRLHTPSHRQGAAGTSGGDPLGGLCLGAWSSDLLFCTITKQD